MVHKILALKDRPEYALALKELIEPHGYEVLPVHTVEQALELLQKEEVNMIIVAIHLREGNVFDFIREVRDSPDEKVRRVPIVCINLNPRLHARYLNDSLRISAKALGANKFITMEPYDPILLWSEIQTMLPPEEVRKTSTKFSVNDNF
jgi:CheY-like chemotaxis protein